MFQVDLGIAVQKACENVTQPLRFLYPLDISIKEKIEAIARSYGAAGVTYSEQVRHFVYLIYYSVGVVYASTSLIVQHSSCCGLIFTRITYVMVFSHWISDFFSHTYEIFDTQWCLAV